MRRLVYPVDLTSGCFPVLRRKFPDRPNWDLPKKNADIFRFFKGMIAFRKVHPCLGRSLFWREDVSWYGVNGQVDLGYLSHSLAFCLHGSSQQDRDIYVMINGYWEELNFHIQEGERAIGYWWLIRACLAHTIC